MVKALICGGGNGPHVMAGLAASQPGVTVNVLTLFADEAERWTAKMKDNPFEVVVHNPDGTTHTVTDKPALVTKDPKAAMEGVDIAVLVVPAFAHAQYLKELRPYVKPGLVLVGLPGQAGFEFEVRDAWHDLIKDITLLSFESLPWACRMTEFGRRAESLGTKASLNGASISGQTPPPEDATGMLQKCVGKYPVLQVTGHLIGITLMAVNAYIHPSIMYGKWHDWDGTAFDTSPLFYNGLDRPSAALLSALSDEVVATAKAIIKQKPEINLDTVSHMLQYIIRCYGEDISDKTDLFTCIQTNKAYTGLTHPVVKNEEGKFVPNFKFRYLEEDIPYGLIVMRGIATIAGVPTPNMDKVLWWAQGVMGKEYLTSSGEMAGRDLAETRAPQKYGFTTMEAMLAME